MARYRRVLLKLSGEALMGSAGYGIDPEVLKAMADAVAEAYDGTSLAIVVGGGNIFRGVSSSARDMDRAEADLMGMLATVMNALALGEALRARRQERRRLEQFLRVITHNVMILFRVQSEGRDRAPTTRIAGIGRAQNPSNKNSICGFSRPFTRSFSLS